MALECLSTCGSRLGCERHGDVNLNSPEWRCNSRPYCGKVCQFKSNNLLDHPSALCASLPESLNGCSGIPHRVEPLLNPPQCVFHSHVRHLYQMDERQIRMEEFGGNGNHWHKLLEAQLIKERDAV